MISNLIFNASLSLMQQGHWPDTINQTGSENKRDNLQFVDNFTLKSDENYWGGHQES